MKNKRGLSSWGWILIILLIILIAVGIYFIFFKQYSTCLGEGCKEAISSIPQPPALPS